MTAKHNRFSNFVKDFVSSIVCECNMITPFFFWSTVSMAADDPFEQFATPH